MQETGWKFGVKQNPRTGFRQKNIKQGLKCTHATKCSSSKAPKTFAQAGAPSHEPL